jgi:hypothetical protein
LVCIGRSTGDPVKDRLAFGRVPGGQQRSREDGTAQWLTGILGHGTGEVDPGGGARVWSGSAAWAAGWHGRSGPGECSACLLGTGAELAAGAGRPPWGIGGGRGRAIAVGPPLGLLGAVALVPLAAQLAGRGQGCAVGGEPAC